MAGILDDIKGGALSALRYNGRDLIRDTGPVGRAAANVATLGTYQHPHDTAAYLKGMGNAFNPNTILSGMTSTDPRQQQQARANLLNYAGIILPGGSRGRGPSPLQDMYLRQLRTSPVRAVGTRSGVMTAINRYSAERNPEIAPIAEKLGYTSGDPLMELLSSMHGNPAARTGTGRASEGSSRVINDSKGKSWFFPSRAVRKTVTMDEGVPPTIAQILAKSAIQRRN